MRRVLGLIPFLFAVAGVEAATVTYSTPAGYTFNSLPDDFTVSITTAANTITVAFTDSTSNPTSDTQGISGLALSLNFGTTNTPSVTSSTGQLINIASGGSWSNDTTDSITHWAASNAGVSNNTTTIYLSVFSGGTPQDLVIGQPASNSVYSSANSSIAGSKHNPFIQGTATFVLNLLGVTSNTQVSSATFNFGTAQGLCLGGTVNQCVSGTVSTPEPGTWTLLLLGVVLIGAPRLRRCRGAVFSRKA
ncbi:MAG TPA: PEP-CTERM sorting domain-containing protein [Bryobacteraceae bacterium]|jgi:hypothetical protein